MQFSDVIESVEELREVIEPPNEVVTAKDFDAFDDICRDFIARSPFILIASTDGEGRVDISPKGDPPGFVRVLDDRTIAIPDRPGNHRADTFENIVRHPWVSIIFLIPGTKNTLRLRGRATIVRDAELRESLVERGRVPELALVVELTTGFFHCAKCIVRSKLWAGEVEAAPGDERLLAEAMVAQGDLRFTVDEMQEIIVDDEVNRLY